MNVKLKTSLGQDKAGAVVEVSDKHGALLISVGVAESVVPEQPKTQEDA